MVRLSKKSVCDTEGSLILSGLGAAFGMQADGEGWLQVNYSGGLQLMPGRKLKIGSTEISEAQLAALLKLL